MKIEALVIINTKILYQAKNLTKNKKQNKKKTTENKKKNPKTKTKKNNNNKNTIYKAKNHFVTFSFFLIVERQIQRFIEFSWTMFYLDKKGYTAHLITALGLIIYYVDLTVWGRYDVTSKNQTSVCNICKIKYYANIVLNVQERFMIYLSYISVHIKHYM